MTKNVGAEAHDQVEVAIAIDVIHARTAGVIDDYWKRRDESLSRCRRQNFGRAGCEYG
jgi:hypothetical protein